MVVFSTRQRHNRKLGPFHSLLAQWDRLPGLSGHFSAACQEVALGLAGSRRLLKAEEK